MSLLAFVGFVYTRTKGVCLCTLNDFTGFWVNSLLVIKQDLTGKQWIHQSNEQGASELQPKFYNNSATKAMIYRV
jgi:hypothetical protein